MIKNILSILSFFVVGAAQADTIPDEQIAVPTVNSNSALEPGPTLDSRLPPVIPGQEVNVGGGRKVRMISTTGPIPVSSATPAPDVPANVIVDMRKE